VGEICQALMNEIAAFGGGTSQADDITLVVIARR
jgi:serine phosphatase RsbU (regulator of sigma subunit)